MASRDVDALIAPLEPLLALCYCMVIIMGATTLVRLYTRIHLMKQFGVDDFLMVTSILVVLSLWPTHLLYRKHLWLFRSAEWKDDYREESAEWLRRLSVVEKYIWVISIVFPAVLTIFKLSVLAFYCRFLPRKPYRFWIHTTVACLVIFGIVAAIASILTYDPVHKAWDPFATLHDMRINIFALLIANGVFHLLTDIILLVLPAPAIVRLNTSWKRRLGLMLLFSLGLLGTAVTVARLWQTLHLIHLVVSGAPTLHYMAQRLVLTLLGVVEMAIIPICANMPALAAFWRMRGRRPPPPPLHPFLCPTAAAAAEGVIVTGDNRRGASACRQAASTAAAAAASALVPLSKGLGRPAEEGVERERGWKLSGRSQSNVWRDGTQRLLWRWWRN